MVADAVAWLCRSPRRLLVTVGGLVLVVVVGAAMLNGGGSSGAATAAPEATPTPSVSAAAVPDAQPFVDAAVTFVGTWGERRDESKAAWHKRVAPLATEDLGPVLTRPAEAARPEGAPSVRFVAQGSAMILVPVDTGRDVLVTVVSSGTALLVSDIQPVAGDEGLTP